MVNSEKRTLAAIFVKSLEDGSASEAELASALGLEAEEISARLAGLEKKNLVERSLGETKLTPAGRKAIKVVFMGGGFEVIHPGHIHTITKAKELGDALVVVIARDSTIRKRKGREPVSAEGERLKLLSSIRGVDAAILGSEVSIYDTLEKVRPDVVALGYDQYHQEADIAREAKNRGIPLTVVRLDTPNPLVKTSKILTET